MQDVTRLSYWFPKLQEAGLPVPKTILVNATKEELEGIRKSFDQEGVPHTDVYSLAERITAAANEIGYPCFLRTDHFSGKHDWKNTCFITKPEDILQHIVNIAHMWECVNMFAPPCDVWVVREFLPTIPHGICLDFTDMPICKEFRFFVDDEVVKCFHPYWPMKALEQGEAIYNDDFNYEDFCTPDDEDLLRQLASAAGKACGGAWSVDLLETKNGWYVTDMAEANSSYHWEGCEIR